MNGGRPHFQVHCPRRVLSNEHPEQNNAAMWCRTAKWCLPPRVQRVGVCVKCHCQWRVGSSTAAPDITIKQLWAWAAYVLEALAVLKLYNGVSNVNQQPLRPPCNPCPCPGMTVDPIPYNTEQPCHPRGQAVPVQWPAATGDGVRIIIVCVKSARQRRRQMPRQAPGGLRRCVVPGVGCVCPSEGINVLAHTCAQLAGRRSSVKGAPQCGIGRQSGRPPARLPG